MIPRPWLVACIAVFAAAPALAASSPAKPLDLSLPLQFVPAPASTTHGASKSAPATKPRRHGAQPDPLGATGMQPPDAFLSACNNKAYKKSRVFGNATVGAFSGSQVEGNYQAGRVGVAQALGSCSHPSGGIIFSVGFSRASVNGPYWPPY